VPHLLDKIEQFERVIPKAQAVDEALAKMLETEIAAARAKVDNLTNSFETKAKAAAPLLEVKTQLYAPPPPRKLSLGQAHVAMQPSQRLCRHPGRHHEGEPEGNWRHSASRTGTWER